MQEEENVVGILRKNLVEKEMKIVLSSDIDIRNISLHMISVTRIASI